jgi:hypothetical protein
MDSNGLKWKKTVKTQNGARRVNSIKRRRAWGDLNCPTSGSGDWTVDDTIPRSSQFSKIDKSAKTSGD